MQVVQDIKTVTVPIASQRATLIAFLRHHFRPPLSSVGHIERCLDRGLFVVNDSPERVHTRRVSAGDVVALRAPQIALDAARFAVSPLRNVLFSPGHYGVWEKPPGMPLHGSQPDTFEASLPQSLAALLGPSQPDVAFIDCIASVGRSTQGPAIVALAPAPAARLRHDYCESRFRFTFRVIVHGTPPPSIPASPHVLNVRRVASTESTVGVLTSLELEMSSDDNGLRRILNDAGFPVLGNGALSRASKTGSHGIYLACTAVSFPDPLLPLMSGKVVNICFELPSKFAGILQRERRCYEEKSARATETVRQCVAMREKYLRLSESQNVDRDFAATIASSGPEDFVAFCGIPFFVSACVMFPRRSSEVLVATAVKKLGIHCCDDTAAIDGYGPRVVPLKSDIVQESNSFVRVLDLGVGSGALLVSTMLQILASFGSCNVRGLGVDICEDALAVARRNAGTHGLARNTRFVNGDFSDLRFLFDETDAELGQGGFDVILCNPPYLTSNEYGRETGSVQGPNIALLAHDCEDKRLLHWQRKGMACYKSIAIAIGACSPPLIKEGGRLVVELGGKRSQSGVEFLFSVHAGLELEEVVGDDNGFTRCLVFK
jgi:methylase of polypeptide subunit release factors